MQNFCRKTREDPHFRDLGVGRRILKLVSEKQGFMLWTGLNWLRIGSSGGLL
jgi:hypothetical protein